MVNAKKTPIEGKEMRRESKYVNIKNNNNESQRKMAREEKREKKVTRQKTIIKITVVSPSLSVITLNNIKNLNLFPGNKDIFLSQRNLVLAFSFMFMTGPYTLPYS